MIINEVAWMGTSTSTADEWIELYNNGANAVDVTGWSLSAGDGSPTIQLSGTIPASSYVLLERTDDNSVLGIPALVLYTGALSNSGEVLILKNAQSETADTLDASGGWQAGSSTTFETMQRSGNSWITASPTPGAQNETPGTTQPETSNPPEENTQKENDSDKEEIVQAPPKRKEDLVYSARMIPPEGTIVAGSPAEFKSLVLRSDDTTITTGYFVWSFGDGTETRTYSSLPVGHVYTTPGNYMVVFRYFISQTEKVPSTIHKKEITVISAEVSLRINESGFVISNQSKKDIDIGGWRISDPMHAFILPEYTIIKSGSSITIPFGRAGFQSHESKLFTPEGNSVISQRVEEKVIRSSAQGASKNPVSRTAQFVSDLETLETVHVAEADTASRPGITTSKRHSSLPYFIGFLLLSILGFVWYTRKYTYSKLEEVKTHSGKELEDILYYDDR